MIDDVAKDFLHGRLKTIREALVWKLDALSEYDIRRPLTATGTNLLGLVKHLATGEARGYLRDEPESYCYAIGCPFYDACWEGYVPTREIVHERELRDVALFIEARQQQKDAESLRKARRESLRGVEGVTPDGTVVRWTLAESSIGNISDKLDVRVPSGLGPVRKTKPKETV